MALTRSAVLAALTSLLTSLLVPATPSTAAEPAPVPRPALTNLAHLDWLRTTVTPPPQPGHTTYRLDAEPAVGVLWTYADRNPDGTYRRIGGGAYDPATGTWSQGAYNADDISRAAVVYLRHWRQTGSGSSRAAAYQLLRGLAYLQTAAGPNAGNVVLWMQPDGRLNPSAEPKDQPDPSDSGPSYWLARTLWALGEGYAAFRDADPGFAGFLRDRFELALDALERQVLVRYGQYQVVDGERVPAWLIVNGADASAEAVLGLSAYVTATGDPRARRALAALAHGIAEMAAGDARTWPYGAVLPWALSRSLWHGWGGNAPAALARAATALGDPSLLPAALSDSASFTPHLLISGGPDNGWLPAPSDRTQIAYGVDSRVQSLLAVAAAAGSPAGRRGLRDLAAVAASWYFGDNAAGEPMYDPATGRTYDGVAGDGTVNRNSGAESTIHGLLSMLTLDAAPDVAARARVASPVARHTWRLVEAEAGRLDGAATVVRPDQAWTGESLWSGGAYAELRTGGSVRLSLPASGPSLLMPVVLRIPGAGRTRWVGGDRTAGVVDHGRIGPQGVSPAPGALTVTTLPGRVFGGPLTVSLAGSGTAAVDAVLVQPEVEHLVLSGPGHGTALVRNAATGPRSSTVAVPGPGTATVTVYDSTGQAVAAYRTSAQRVPVRLPAGGFALVLR